MSTLTQLQQLEAIVEARYRNQQQSFARLVAEENRLRAELTRLDGYLKKTRALPNDEKQMRAIGADIVWQGWLGRSKAQLNLKLAQVLAIKEQHLKQVRTAYGKLLAMQELILQSRSASRKKTDKNTLSQAVDFALFPRQNTL